MAGNQVQLNVTADASGAIGEFDRVIRSTEKISRALNLVGKEGADDAEILERVGREGGQAFQSIIERGQAAGKAAKDIARELKTLAQIQRNAAMDSKADAQAAAQATAAQAAAQASLSKQAAAGAADIKAQSDALAGLSRQAMALASSLVQASSGFEQQRAKLTGLYHDTDQAKQAFSGFVEFASKTPFEVRSVVDAAIQLQALGQDAQAILPIAGDLAARFGRDIPDAAQALGKALSGSQDGVQILIDSFGVSRQKLKEYGATVDESGGIILRGEANLQKFRQAIMGIAGKEWAGSMALQAETLQGKLSNLSDASEQLKARMGDALAPTVRDLAESLTGMISGVQKSAPLLVDMAGIAIGAAAAMTSLGAGVAALSVALPIAAAAITPMIAGLTALAAAATIANQTMHEQISTYEEVDKQTRSASESVQALAKAHRDWAGMSASELHRMGVTAKDTASVVRGLQEEIALLEQQGTQPHRVTQLKQEIQQWRDLGAALGDIAREEKAAAERAAAAAAARKEQLKVAQDLAKAEQSLLQVRVDALTRELAESERAGQATLAQRTAVIDAQMQLEDRRHRDALQKIRDEQETAEQEGKATAASRAVSIREMEALEAQHLEAVQKFTAQRLELQRDAERKALQYTSDRIAAQQQREADTIALLEARLKAGERVESDLVAAHQRAQDLMLAAERARHEQAMSDLKKLGGDQIAVQSEVAKHAETMAHLAAQARLREVQAAQQVHDAILALTQDETQKRQAELDKQVAAFRAAGASEQQIAEYTAAAKSAAEREHRQRQAEGTRQISDLRQSAMDDELRALQERAAKGEDVTAQEADLVRRRHALERDEIRSTLDDDAKRYGDRATAEEAMRLRLEADARSERRDLDEIAAARKKYLDEHAAKLDEIAAKKDAAFGGSPYSMEEFFKRQGIEQLAPRAEQPAAPAVSLTPIPPMTSSASPATTPAAGAASAGAGTTINVYVGQQRASGLTSATESTLQQAGDSILRDLRFGR